MALKIKSVDISKLNCDVVVNSLGAGQNVAWYGEVCEALLRGAASHELISLIHSWEHEAITGKIFITDGYNLPAKNIIHIVTPSYQDDKGLKTLERAYKLILIIAYKNNWKNIALPLLGTGSNGYPHSFVLKMVMNLCSVFSTLHPDMNITISMPIVINPGVRELFDQDSVDQLIDNFYKENSKITRKSFNYSKDDFEYIESLDIYELIHNSVRIVEREVGLVLEAPTRNLDIECGFQPKGIVAKKKAALSKPKKSKNELLNGGKRPTLIDMTLLPIMSISCYIDNYIEARYNDEEEKKLVKKYVNEIVSGDIDSSSLKTKHNVEEKRTTVSVSMLMRYILALRMTIEEANSLLCFCGRTFSPISKQDRVYAGIINRKIYDIYIVNGLCLKANVEQIFGYDKLEPADLKGILNN